jgi:hypothetical protein
MKAPNGSALSATAVVLLVVAIGVSFNTFGPPGASITESLSVTGVYAGPWLIAAIVAWSGGRVVDAVMYGKRDLESDD